MCPELDDSVNESLVVRSTEENPQKLCEQLAGVPLVASVAQTLRTPQHGVPELAAPVAKAPDVAEWPGFPNFLEFLSPTIPCSTPYAVLSGGLGADHRNPKP